MIVEVIAVGTELLIGQIINSNVAAIGSRLAAEVSAMQQATVNASQAISLLQVADGAMSQHQDILVRMKTLSVQAGSG